MFMFQLPFIVNVLVHLMCVLDFFLLFWFLGKTKENNLPLLWFDQSFEAGNSGDRSALPYMYIFRCLGTDQELQRMQNGLKRNYKSPYGCV